MKITYTFSSKNYNYELSDTEIRKYIGSISDDALFLMCKKSYLNESKTKIETLKKSGINEIKDFKKKISAERGFCEEYVYKHIKLFTSSLKTYFEKDARSEFYGRDSRKIL